MQGSFKAPYTGTCKAATQWRREFGSGEAVEKNLENLGFQKYDAVHGSLGIGHLRFTGPRARVVGGFKPTRFALNEYICRASDDVTKVTVMVAENDDSLTGVCKMCIPADDTGMVSNLFDWSKYINWREDFWPGEMAFQDNKGRKARNLRVSLTSGSVVPSDGSITKEFPVYGYTAGGGQQTVMMECLCVDATFGRVPTFSSKAGASAKIFKLVH